MSHEAKSDIGSFDLAPAIESTGAAIADAGFNPFQACAYDNSNPTLSLAAIKGNTFENAGLNLGDKVLAGAQDLVPYFGDSQPVKQAQAAPASENLSVPNVFAQVAKDACHGQKGMNALKNQAFDDLMQVA